MRTSRAAVPGLLGLAGVLRLAYLAQNRHSPFFTHPIIDGAEYVARARAILADGPGWERVPIHAPLYPSFVAAVFGATDGSFLVLIALQHLLGLATLFLMHRVARRAFGETAALGALALGALAWAPIYYEGQPLSEPLVTFLLTLATWLLLRANGEKGWRGAALAGLAMGAAVITRANVLALAVLAAGWLARRPHARAAGVAGFAAAAAIVIAPVTLENLRAEGQFVLVQANGGFNLHLANNEDADVAHTVRPGVEWRRLRREGAREAPEGPGARDRYWTGKALGYIAAHPLRTATRMGKRFALFLDDRETGASQDPAWHRAQFPALRFAPLGAGWAAALALLGIALRRRGIARGRAPALLALLTAGAVLSLLVFPYFSRYRAPLLPLLWMFGGAGATAAIDAWRSARGERATAKRAGIAAGGALLLALTLFDPFGLRPEPVVRIEYQLGRVAGERGDGAAAITYYREALRKWPDDPDILNNLGLVLDLTGRPEEARQVLVAALAAAPDHVEARMNLAALDREEGRMDEAAAGYERAVEDDPLKVEALVALAATRTEQGRPDEAIDLYRRALDVRPGERVAVEELGRLLLVARRNDEARAFYESAAKRRSTQAVAWIGLARLKAMDGRLGEAARLVDDALRHEPGNAEARALREQLRAAGAAGR